LIEFFYPRGETNLSEEEILAVKKDPFYDLALYKLVPTQWVLLGYFLVSMNQEMGLIERIGRISSMGIM
jgi:alkane 1-monooxygenase